MSCEDITKHNGAEEPKKQNKSSHGNEVKYFTRYNAILSVFCVKISQEIFHFRAKVSKNLINPSSCWKMWLSRKFKPYKVVFPNRKCLNPKVIEYSDIETPQAYRSAWWKEITLTLYRSFKSIWLRRYFTSRLRWILLSFVYGRKDEAFHAFRVASRLVPKIAFNLWIDFITFWCHLATFVCSKSFFPSWKAKHSRALPFSRASIRVFNDLRFRKEILLLLFYVLPKADLFSHFTLGWDDHDKSSRPHPARVAHRGIFFEGFSVICFTSFLFIVTVKLTKVRNWRHEKIILAQRETGKRTPPHFIPCFWIVLVNNVTIDLRKKLTNCFYLSIVCSSFKKS